MIAGIDIGTSYSSICVLDESGKIKPVDIATGTSMFGSKYSLPSAVFVEDNGNVLVGQAAMNSRKRRPQNFRMEFKRDLGQDIPIVLGNASFLPEDFYTELFRHMKASAGKMSSEAIETVCLTCPAAFGKKKREKVLKAAKAAGFFNVQLVDEPTAAAMSFKEDGVLSGSKKLLIYDFGGGTFDVSLLAYEDGRFSLMTEPSGLERCGGIDIDRMIFEDMQKCIDPEILASIVKDPKKAMRLNVQLSELAVKAKHHLSTASVYEEYIEVGMDDFEYTLTLDKLNTMIAGMVGQTIDVCRKMVEDAGIKVKDLSAILMVGGTSRVPLVQTMVKQMAAGVPVYCSVDVDLAVAKGALMFAKSGERLENGGKAEKAGGARKGGKTENADKKDAGAKAGSLSKNRQERKDDGSKTEEAKKPEKVNEQQLDEWFRLGCKYYFGDGIPVDYKKAVKWYHKAAEGGYAAAQTSLGTCYEEGKGVAKDVREAKKWYRKAAEGGNATAQYFLGNCYMQSRGAAQNFDEAVKWYSKAAEQGYVSAQYMLGRCYDEGSGVEKNAAEAEKWYKKAAAQDHFQAQQELAKRQKRQEKKISGKEPEKEISETLLEKWFELGIKYDFGKGVPVDYKEAVRWYRKAAEAGHAVAQYNLGICYANGQGVTQDYSEAVKWYRKAAEAGYAAAQNNLGYRYENGLGVSKDIKEAVKWYHKAAESGDANAQCNLATCYYNGEGVTQDYSEAVKWYRKAAESGNAAAQCNLGYCYENGLDVSKDIKEAVKWYRKAAEAGNANAQCNLATCYYNGEGVTQDYNEALNWYFKAAGQGLAGAQYMLGLCYDLGKGVKRNTAEAEKWYKKAAAQGHGNAQKELNSLNKTLRKVRNIFT